MIPETFTRYYQGKIAQIRLKRQVYTITEQELWQHCAAVWPQWHNGDYTCWYVDRKPGETQWRADTVVLTPWQEHFKNMNTKSGPRTGRPCPNMREHTDYPVRVEIEGEVYPSLNEAARCLGVAASTINHRCHSPRFPQWQRL
jgi:hypothetical protein